MREISNPSRRTFLKAMAFGAAALPAGLFKSLDARTAGQDTKIRTLLRNGPPDKRINLIFLPEGFTAKEEKPFREYAQQVIAQGFKDYALYKELLPFINFYSAFVPSTGPFKGDGGGAFGVKWDKNTNPTEFNKTRVDEMKALVSRETKDAASSIISAIIINDATVKGYSAPSSIIGTTAMEVMMHETTHGFGQGDEYYDSSYADYKFEEYGTLNIDRDDKKPRWQPGLDKKVKGIKTSLISKTKNCFRGEDGSCLMKDITPGNQLGPLCALGVYLYARKRIGVLEDATPEDLISINKSGKLAIEVKVIPSATHVPQVQAWSTTGTTEAMDEVAGKLRDDGKLSPDSFKDKAFKKVEMTFDAKKKTYVPKTALPAGNHCIAMLFYDPNPIIFMDPENVTKAKKVYRVDVADK